jgi:hypothetical protein
MSFLLLLSNAEDDGVSPSQHELARKKQRADKYVVPNSTSGEEEEEADDDEEEEEEECNKKKICPTLLLSLGERS